MQVVWVTIFLNVKKVEMDLKGIMVSKKKSQFQKVIFLQRNLIYVTFLKWLNYIEMEQMSDHQRLQGMCITVGIAEGSLIVVEQFCILYS